MERRHNDLLLRVETSAVSLDKVTQTKVSHPVQDNDVHSDSGSPVEHSVELGGLDGKKDDEHIHGLCDS
jgi:hypothetical protein